MLGLVCCHLVMFQHPAVREIRGDQKTPENATHPKTSVPDGSENVHFRVCCIFGCSLFSSKRAPKHTRKSNTPEIADSGNLRLSAFSGVLHFRVCFGACERKGKSLMCSTGDRFSSFNHAWCREGIGCISRKRCPRRVTLLVLALPCLPQRFHS